MKQITETVNNFLALIVGIGLVCMATFVFLLASAQLSDSVLGGLLARTAGETARIARTESLSFWGQVGGEVVAGLGYGRAPLSTGGVSASVTPVAVAATVGAPQPTVNAPRPTATVAPSSYIRSSPFSEAGLLMWRGVDQQGQPLPLGVNLEQVQQQAAYALSQNPGDRLAQWLLTKVDGCRPLYDQMVKADYQDSTQADAIRGAANALLSQCNPRLYVAYANARWAELSVWTATIPPDAAQAKHVLQGLKISLGAKVDGPARDVRPQDSVQVTVLAIPEFGLGSRSFVLTVATLDELLGAEKWSLNSGTLAVAGELYPANLPEPVAPSEADLSVPAPSDNTAASAAVGALSASGKYVVQTGDTVYSIARQFNVTPEELVAANPDTLGYNPNYIVIGQELNIPAAP